MFEVRFWEDSRGKFPVLEWIHELSKPQSRSVAKLLSLLKVKGNALPPPYAKNLGQGLWELRDNTTGPGMRIYYCFQKEKIIILLAAGQKSTQERDIKRARRILDELEKI